MMEAICYTVWVHGRGGSLFGDSSRPVNRDGSFLAVSDEPARSATVLQAREPLIRVTPSRRMWRPTVLSRVPIWSVGLRRFTLAQ